VESLDDDEVTGEARHPGQAAASFLASVAFSAANRCTLRRKML